MRETVVTLPTLHSDQVKAFWHTVSNRFSALRCGRRYGKTKFDITIACDCALKTQKGPKYVGWFAPDYKRLSEARNEIFQILDPVKRSSSKVDGNFVTRGGGHIDFWTLQDELAGRSGKYHLVIIDEAAFAKKNMMEIWKQAIRPTLVDFRGRAIVTSNTRGKDDDNFFYNICTDPQYGFVDFHAPSANNPFLPSEELEDLRRTEMPLVFDQEYNAIFVDWSGVAFFALQNMLVDGNPVPFPKLCDAVFATIDTATKTGIEHDGTAVVYWALINYDKKPRLIILDYSLVQIEGSLLETWLPSVFENLEHLAKECHARSGSVGAWIEDKSSGMILLQQAKRRGWKAQAAPSELTAVGKSERAVSVSGYVYRGQVKFSERAYNRDVVYKGKSRNHLLTQVLAFRIGDDDKDREDDAADAFMYGIAIALGNAEGF